MLTDTILALFIAFFACAALCPIMIPILHRMKFGQQVRDDGPQSHLKKSGTPTMGGIMIVLAIALGLSAVSQKGAGDPAGHGVYARVRVYRLSR